jgi:cell wall-associated NlpC family hydrolase
MKPPLRRHAKRAVALSACALAALAMVGSGPSTGWADPRPSASDVARSKQDVKDRANAVGRIEARLAQADGQLERLAAIAELAVERFNGAQVRLERAKKAYAQAQQKLADAQAACAQTRRDVAAFAARAYQLNGGLSGLSAAIGSPGGPQAFLDRQSMIKLLADRQAGAIQRAQAAAKVADVLGRQAGKALGAQQAATKDADAAKVAAEGAVARQHAAVQAIEARKAQLVKELGQARAKADDLERRRAAALEAAREAAAVNAARAQGNSRTTSALSGAGQGAVAVHAALSRLGTPYSWGGGDTFGPTYGVAQGADIKGFDCSGLMLYAWSKAGVQLDHWTGTQWTSGPHVPVDLLRPGDLVFFATDTGDPDTIHHVGMYIGQDQMIEAPYTGARVRISSIWRNGFIGATRPVG